MAFYLHIFLCFKMCVFGIGWRNKALAFSATLTFSQRQQKKLLLQMPALINLLPSSRADQQDSDNYKYSVIKSNCHKQYLSEEPKNCKKWPNPMIFRKLLCGGFGILMSQNYQTEKMLHFTGVLKW